MATGIPRGTTTVTAITDGILLGTLSAALTWVPARLAAGAR